MMKKIKPARDGVLVRKADGTHLDADGEALPMTAWWHRREAEGDVIVSDIPVETATQNAPARPVKEK